MISVVVVLRAAYTRLYHQIKSVDVTMISFNKSRTRETTTTQRKRLFFFVRPVERLAQSANRASPYHARRRRETTTTALVWSKILVMNSNIYVGQESLLDSYRQYAGCRIRSRQRVRKQDDPALVISTPTPTLPETICILKPMPHWTAAVIMPYSRQSSRPALPI